MKYSSFYMLSFFLWVVGSTTAFAQNPTQTIVENPAAFSMEIIDDIEKKGAEAAADKIGRATNTLDAKTSLTPFLTAFEKKKAHVAKIVSDKSYEGVVRVVTIYTYGLVSAHPFLYFQMTYKMTDKGWVMTWFAFKTENNHAFPADMRPYVH